jgi:hypothetical protein
MVMNPAGRDRQEYPEQDLAQAVLLKCSPGGLLESLELGGFWHGDFSTN